jgi:hypothetical protein
MQDMCSAPHTLDLIKVCRPTWVDAFQNGRQQEVMLKDGRPGALVAGNGGQSLEGCCAQAGLCSILEKGCERLQDTFETAQHSSGIHTSCIAPDAEARTRVCIN